jgi:anthranilate phosphoribosyltransferase
VHGTVKNGGGMDELSTLGQNQICKVESGRLSSDLLDPQTLGFAPAKLEDLVGGDANENAGMIESILSGRDPGPKRDIAVLNAAAGFVITGKAADLAAGKALAESLIDRGAAHAKLVALRDWC